MLWAINMIVYFALTAGCAKSPNKPWWKLHENVRADQNYRGTIGLAGPVQRKVSLSSALYFPSLLANSDLRVKYPWLFDKPWERWVYFVIRFYADISAALKCRRTT